MKKSKAIYPGTFDPITLGHLDIIKRAAKIFHYVTIAIVASSNKSLLFTLDERINLVRKVTKHLYNVKVEIFNSLTTDFAKKQKANILIRGLRAVTDFEYEMKLTYMNQCLAPTIESIFFMTSKELSFISSSLVKEVAYYGGDVSNLLPVSVNQALVTKMKNQL
ncbi:pantetheine-phosphate adenylyltransferase [Candidatus Pantoea edessiphila]|uniref:Phosphopantetheine adenylyltransferase n=1 Tax=Candidatus Pantoea edessiphila TaxID=2044610 RepID=A0A2P5SVI9_9GAMM|nr:pantetheine-phosphate adenylyltransferase [Candidatus Pantoea edessiphila]PPI86355.1 pantetheine-phosphate adenylyltransferase [Candidatus Pantoea edessiphila]